MDLSSTADPVPRLGEVTQIHTDPDGHQWRLTVYWARIDGAAVPVGLDLRAFTLVGGVRVRPTGGVLTAAMIRSLRIGEIVEQSRQHGTWTSHIGKKATRRPTQPKTKTVRPRRPGRPAKRGDDFIAEVAALFHEAKAQGGEPARKPWRYVAARLEEQGVDEVTDGQLKNWSRRAKNLGLLPTKDSNRKERG